MKKYICFFVIVSSFILLALCSPNNKAKKQLTKPSDVEVSDTVNSLSSRLAWPTIISSETRPWTWWWWPGNAVTKQDITANLEAFHKSGIGGVNIICLLDVQDDHARKLRYLSPEWVEAIVHAKREAHRLGMEVDMSPVYGWAFGGPWVPRDESCVVIEVKQWNNANTNLSEADLKDLNALIVVTEDGHFIDLTQKILAKATMVHDFSRIKGTYYAILNRRGSSMVRMSAPDYKGLVVDHLSATAVRNYFNPFDQAFKDIGAEDLPRAFNNDSWEISLDWTSNFFDEFEKRRGYDLKSQFPAFMGEGPQDIPARVACDYRQTLSDLMINQFTKVFRKWAVDHRCQITGEVQNEPGNEIDINALYHIPQADMGGPRAWYIEKNGDYATGEIFRRCKIPASAAHILGKPLISSETLTCMGPILDTPLDLVKEKLDLDMIAGVNHTMFHGICYSPINARWPGWLFYAGTHLGSFNPMWRQQRKHLCDYISRCQSFLQSGNPNSDVLIYYPIFDLWSQRQYGNPSTPGIVNMDAGPKIADQIWRNGYDFDFITDKLLDSLKVVDGNFTAPGTSYRTLIISGCKLIPVETLEKIIQFVKDGASVIIHGNLPSDVPGLGQLKERRKRFQKALAIIKESQLNADETGVPRLGKGRIIFGQDLVTCMVQSGIHREEMTDLGLHYTRRKDQYGTTYFITNPKENKRVEGWLPTAAAGESAAIFDPMTGEKGVANFRKEGKSGCSLYLQLDSGESCIVRIFNTSITGQAWSYHVPNGKPITLTGKWMVRFIEGGEIIPHSEIIDSLASWTTWKSDQLKTLKAFSGIACYSLQFHTPAVKSEAWIIDLGKVCHTASVRLNGKTLGDIFANPMRVVTNLLKEKGENLLEIEVANAPVNRAADLDIKGIHWQKVMGEDAKSFVIGDFLFQWNKKDSSWIPRPSGLIGPVQLIPINYSNNIGK